MIVASLSLPSPSLPARQSLPLHHHYLHHCPSSIIRSITVYIVETSHNRSERLALSPTRSDPTPTAQISSGPGPPPSGLGSHYSAFQRPGTCLMYLQSLRAPTGISQLHVKRRISRDTPAEGPESTTNTHRRVASLGGRSPGGRERPECVT